MDEAIYLDNAATTFPKPRSVTQSVMQSVKYYCANPGRSSHALAMKAAECVYGCREKISDFFGGRDTGAVFTLNATHAINTALKAVLKKGDHVLISDIEHNALLRPIAALAERGEISYGIYSTIGTHDDILKDIASKVQNNTSIICACHRSNICDLCLPIRQIGMFCRNLGITFLCDVSQSAGAMEIDMKLDNIDILCAPAHKGLYGIPGCGFALFSDNLIKAKDLSTFIEGGTGTDSRQTHMPDFLPERLEAGTLPLPAICALSAGIDFINSIGLKRIAAHEARLSKMLHSALADIPDLTLYGSGNGGTVLFSAKNIPSEEFAEILDGYGIYVRAGLHCAPLAHARLGTPKDGAVRASFGAFNKERDVQRFVYTCKKIIRSGA